MFQSTPIFDYHIGWKSKGKHPGHHKSNQRGMGIEFAGHTSLLSYPDPRRIDIRQSIRDPLGEIHVKIFNQRSATPVMIVCDLSASMNFGGGNKKIKLASEVAKSIAHSVIDQHDALGLIGFDDEIREDWLAPISFRSQHALTIIQELEKAVSKNKSNRAIQELYQYMPRERSLIFFISDFHMPEIDLENCLSNLMRHHVVPMILWDKREYINLPNFGIVTITDPESSKKNILFLRKELKEKIVRSFEKRRSVITKVFMNFDIPPFFIDDHFDANKMTEYFNQFVGA
jgi:uncharacterized protein (DUF58 family)